MTIDPFAPKKAKRPKNFIGTWRGQPSQTQLDGFSNQLAGARTAVQGIQKQIDLSKVNNAKAVVLPPVEPPVAPDPQAFVSPDLTQDTTQGTQEQNNATQATTDPFAGIAADLQQQITDKEREVATYASEKAS